MATEVSDADFVNICLTQSHFDFAISPSYPLLIENKVTIWIPSYPFGIGCRRKYNLIKQHEVGFVELLVCNSPWTKLLNSRRFKKDRYATDLSLQCNLCLIPKSVCSEGGFVQPRLNCTSRAMASDVLKYRTFSRLRVSAHLVQTPLPFFGRRYETSQYISTGCQCRY